NGAFTQTLSIPDIVTGLGVPVHGGMVNSIAPISGVFGSRDKPLISTTTAGCGVPILSNIKLVGVKSPVAALRYIGSISRLNISIEVAVCHALRLACAPPE